MEDIQNYTINQTNLNDTYDGHIDDNEVNKSFNNMIIITMSLLIMSISCLTACCRYCEGSPKQPNTLTEKILFTDIMSNEVCSICLEKFTQNEEISLLTCKHQFHKQCVEKWFKKDTSCPICRQSVV